MNIQIKQFIQSLLGVNSLAKRLVFASFALLVAMSCNTQKNDYR